MSSGIYIKRNRMTEKKKKKKGLTFRNQVAVGNTGSNS